LSASHVAVIEPIAPHGSAHSRAEVAPLAGPLRAAPPLAVITSARERGERGVVTNDAADLPSERTVAGTDLLPQRRAVRRRVGSVTP
jgi:hypothetical protein